MLLRTHYCDGTKYRRMLLPVRHTLVRVYILFRVFFFFVLCYRMHTLLQCRIEFEKKKIPIIDETPHTP